MLNGIFSELFPCTDKQKKNATRNQYAPISCNTNKKHSNGGAKNHEIFRNLLGKTFCQVYAAENEHEQNPPFLPRIEGELETHWPQRSVLLEI